MQKFIRWSGWSLLVGAGTTVGLWAALFVHQARQQQQALAALREVEVVEIMCVLPAADGMSVPAGAGISRRKVLSPVESALKELSVTSPMITDERLKSPPGMNTLENLSLMSAKITDSGVHELEYLPRLKQVYLGHTQGIPDECLEELRQPPHRIQVAYEPYGPAP
jgi:hypothetical protein